MVRATGTRHRSDPSWCDRRERHTPERSTTAGATLENRSVSPTPLLGAPTSATCAGGWCSSPLSRGSCPSPPALWGRDGSAPPLDEVDGCGSSLPWTRPLEDLLASSVLPSPPGLGCGTDARGSPEAPSAAEAAGAAAGVAGSPPPPLPEARASRACCRRRAFCRSCSTISAMSWSKQNSIALCMSFAQRRNAASQYSRGRSIINMELSASLFSSKASSSSI
mmetsp:Transcript_4400/g.13113  ORF Transcript_4400/g.13113 Transcript_4400/m.13113 type:complete len:222 (-) Transcript_4400:319-984(-)